MMKTSQKAFLSTIIIISINILIGYCLRVSLFSILFLQFMSFIVYIIVYFGTAIIKISLQITIKSCKLCKLT